MSLLIYTLAMFLDAVLGDPQHWPHPIRWIGNTITLVQRWLRRWFIGDTALYIAGGLLWIVVVGGTFAVTWSAISLLFATHWLFGVVAQVWLGYTTIAARCLSDSANDVYYALLSGDISISRLRLSYIVGRDTTNLNQEQISRAVVETVAENTVDGVIAPLFYLFIGGVPLAMAYKAINTLDSMVGYKNDKYRAIGYVSAKMDDVANWLPARLSWLLFSLSAMFLGYDGKHAFLIGWRDRYQHKSPNCGWSEATVAGALGIRLGGPNDYFGVRVDKPWLGDETKNVTLGDIKKAVSLMFFTSWLSFMLFVNVYGMIYLIRTSL
jgi:adenosylcobinamide-phosphate synthase